MDALIVIFENNGVDMTAKWAMARHTQTRGWQGRFRMSGRVVLEKLVALNGVYVDHTGALVTPAPAAARCLRLASERLCPSTRLHPPPAVLEGPVARDHPIDVAELGTNDAGELLGTQLDRLAACRVAQPVAPAPRPMRPHHG